MISKEKKLKEIRKRMEKLSKETDGHICMANKETG